MDEYEKIALEQTKYYSVFTNLRKERKPDFIKMEISWIQKCLMINYKNYQVWNYIYFFTKISDVTPKKLTFLYNVLKKDARNIHIWTFLLKYIAQRKDYDFGMDFTKQVIIEDGTNNSAYALRIFVVQKKYAYDKQIIEKEIDLFRNVIVHSKNIAVTNYFFGLNKIKNVEKDLFAIYQNTNCLDFRYKFIVYCVNNKKAQFYSLCNEFAKKETELNSFKKHLLTLLISKIQI